MFLLPIIFFILLSSSNPVKAQIPLFYQLQAAYHPITLPHLTQVTQKSTIATTTTTATTITPTPKSTALAPVETGTVLGDTTTKADITKTITVAVLGDSMIDTLGPKIPALETALKQYYPNATFKILNYGYGSRDIEYGLFRLTNDYEYRGQHFSALLSQRPDIIVIESFAYNNFGNTQSGLDRQWLNLGALTTTIRQKLPKTKIILAATIAPFTNTFAQGSGINLSYSDRAEKVTTIKKYLQNIVNFASSQGFSLSDAFHPSLSGNEGSREYISTTDNLHPSASGAKLFSDTVAKTIFDDDLIQ